MEKLSEWMNKNPKQALAGGIGLIALAGLILFLFFKGSGSATNPVAATPGGATTAGGGTGGTAVASNPLAGYPGMSGGADTGMGGAAGAGGATGGGGAGATDNEGLQKGKRPAYSGRSNPMAPLWHRMLHIVRRPMPPPPVFTPPTPQVFVTPRISGAAGPAGPGAPETQPTTNGASRMAGILYNDDRVVAVVEQNSPTTGPTSYVVQPGDPVGRDGRVIAISPDYVTVRYANGRRARVPLRQGSLLGLPPASSISSGLNQYNPNMGNENGMPPDFGGGGYPGMMGGGYPGMGGGYPGMGGGGDGMPPV